MKTSANEIVAQGAATWNERELHESIMKRLGKIRGYVTHQQMINGNYYYWRTEALSEEEALRIARRGNHEEIMYMIHQYGKANRPPQDAGYCYEYYFCWLPETVQEIIAGRNNREEIAAYLSYQGFGERGQWIILGRGNSEEIVWYVSQHGLLPALQGKLLVRGKQEEINMHIVKHGLAPDILDYMFVKFHQDGDLAGLYNFISLRELPVKYQKQMLKDIPQADFFKAYTGRHGLWNEAHPDLVEYRSEDEVGYYITRHPFLCPAAEKILAKKGSHDIKMLYINRRVEHEGGIENFLRALLEAPAPDYMELASCFLRPELTKASYRSHDEATLASRGTKEDVASYLQKNSLSVKALAEMFFNNQEAFRACLG